MQRQRQHLPRSLSRAERLAALAREIAFAEAQLTVFSGNLGPHHRRDQQQILARLHAHLDTLETKRARLLEGQP